MSEQTQTHNKTASEALAKRAEALERGVEYVPFAGDAKIKLNVAIVQRLYCEPTKSGRKCSENDAIKFMLLCQARGLNPAEGDAFLVGYDTRQHDGTVIPKFNLITAHQTFLKRAEVHPKFDGMESGIILIDDEGKVVEREGDFHLEDEHVVGGWAKVHIKERKIAWYRRLSIAKMRNASPFWEKNPAGQIVKCAEADALRSAFPTRVGGMYLAEEISLPINMEMERRIGKGEAVDIDTTRLIEETAPAPAADGPPAETTEAEPASQKNPPKNDKPSAPAATPTPQDELATLVVGANFNYDDFVRGVKKEGLIREIDKYGSFAEIPTSEARRMLRIKDGLLAAIRQEKGML